jgi:hypothetical protein
VASRHAERIAGRRRWLGPTPAKTIRETESQGSPPPRDEREQSPRYYRAARSTRLAERRRGVESGSYSCVVAGAGSRNAARAACVNSGVGGM